MSDGADFLDEQAKVRPSIHKADDLWTELETLWEKGLPRGSRTGWPSLDQFYTVAPGQWTLVTGYPGSGKSEFVDALLVNLTKIGWRFVIFSPENQPLELHVSKMAEKLSGKPFGRGPTERISLEELGRHVEDLSTSFRFLQAPRDMSLTIPAVLDAVTPVLDDLGGEYQGLVIDPWNEIEHWRPQGMNETEYVSHALSTIRNWARERKTHVWLVAHPQKLKRIDGKLPIPTPDSVSGSAHFWNKADAALCVWRDMGKEGEGIGAEVSILVQKIRFRHIGRRGIAKLRWDRVTGTYSDPDAGPRSVADWR